MMINVNKHFYSLLAILILCIGNGISHAQDSEALFSFIKNNPDRTAIRLVRNGEVLANVNPDKKMPLASTMKIIIAIEYAEQVASGKIDPQEMVDLQDIDNYYIPNTDGGAHPAWQKAIANDIEDGKIALREIAKGMIKFSSNANTEWLTDKLGLEIVNDRLKKLGADDHDPISYIVSAIHVGNYLFPDKKGKELQRAINELSNEKYTETINAIHAGLKTGVIDKSNYGDLGLPVQKAWSDRLPASTVATYSDIMQKINSRKYFSEKTHIYLDEVMEFLLESPANRQWLEHAGMKGGSTLFVLTKAMYATDKRGNKITLAYFINDIDQSEYNNLKTAMNDFELKILINPEFRDKIRDEL